MASVEAAVLKHYTNVLTALNIHFYPQNIPMGNSIDDALKTAESKSGGQGGSIPDIKLMLSDSHTRRIPVMIEAKGKKGKLEKLTKSGEIEQITFYEKDGKQREDGTYTYRKGDRDYKAIKDYAVNGAVHYANAVLKYTDYTEVIAIGINGAGAKDGEAENLECKAYYISKANKFIPKLIPQITATDWDLLKSKNTAMLYKLLDTMDLTEQDIADIYARAEADLDTKIHKIHQRIYDDAAITLNTADKMYLFCGLIMAGLSADGLVELNIGTQLKGATIWKQSDGKIILDQISSYLECKNCPKDKKLLIEQKLAPVFQHEDLWRPRPGGESILRSLFQQVKTEIIPCLESELHLDFMGRIFNRLGDWIPLASDVKNDVVLTPRYVAKLMAKLCHVNMNSFVWDRTMGSAGFLVTAMDLMISDAKAKIHDEAKLQERIANIKQRQLFGIEVLPEVFILAALNMILMGDGSSNMVRGDAHDTTLGANFPANVFLLNPPYSADGKGFVFVQEALSMMDSGYAAVLIQENAGAGMGLPYTKQILERNTLIASIHMPNIFCGKAGVQTAIYVFQIGKEHEEDDVVKFIDFSNDGYSRQSRKKSSQDVNLKDVDNATARYQEVEAIILNRKPKTSYYTEANGLYIQDTITKNGDDWTFAQHKPIDTVPTEDDFKRTIQNFLIWEISQTIQFGGVTQKEG